MALVTPYGCTQLSVTPAAHARRRMAACATLSPPRGETTLGWVEATNNLFERDSRPIMLFDGVCNLCNGGVSFVRNNDRNRIIRYQALQSETGKNLLRRSGRAPDDISSVVLVEKDRSYIKSEAVLKIMEYIDLPFPQLAFFLQFIPLFIRDFAYDNVANNRYTIFGRSESCERIINEDDDGDHELEMEVEDLDETKVFMQDEFERLNIDMGKEISMAHLFTLLMRYAFLQS